MEYLFLRRKEVTVASPRQKILLFKAAGRQWEKEFAQKRKDGREITVRSTRISSTSWK